MSQKIYIVKVGGKVIDNQSDREQFLLDLSQLKEQIILVHGGGKIADKYLEKMNIPVNMIDGRRVTDAQTLDVVTMVYCGLINKNLVAKLNSLGCSAIGLSGADGALLTAQKRHVKDVDYGFVGDLDYKKTNAELLVDLLSDGYMPVISTIVADKNGQLLNVNADTLASTLAASIAKNHKTNLYFCFDKKGVLEDQNNPKSIIKKLNKKNYPEYLQKGVFTAGMLPKLENAFNTIKLGVNEIIIGHSQDIKQFFENEYAGTLITN